MAAEYVNRKDHRYFLYQGKTKTGKPKYYCSRKPSTSGVPVESMPEGYEWRESPLDATVSVRRIRSTRIAAFEKDMLIEGIRKRVGLKTFIVDVDGDSLVAYIPDRNPDVVDAVFERILGVGTSNSAAMSEWTAKHVQYSPMMRFNLRDEDERLFDVERWCFRGAIDDWIFLNPPAPLPDLVRKYAKHLGQESFFDLM